MTEAAPAVPAPAPAPSDAPPAPADVPARIAEIENVMRTDIGRYEREGMSDELLNLRRSIASEGDQDEVNAATDADADADDEAGEGEEQEESEEAADQGAHEAVGVDDYTPPEVTGVTWNDNELKPIVDVAARHGVSEAALTEALSAYGEVIQQQLAKIAEVAKTAKAETVAALKAEHGENLKGYLAEVDSAFAALPKEFRKQLKGARLADGRPLLQTLEMVKLFHALGDRQGRHADWRGDQVTTGDRRTVLQQEIAEIDAEMHRDADKLYRPYKNSGLSATDYKQNALREIAKPTPKPSAASLKSEEADLVALHERDPQIFEYAPWKQSGKTGAQRLHAIRSGRA